MDADQDGLGNAEEIAAGSDPLNRDDPKEGGAGKVGFGCARGIATAARQSARETVSKKGAPGLYRKSQEILEGAIVFRRELRRHGENVQSRVSLLKVAKWMGHYGIYGNWFRGRVKNMGIEEVLTAPRVILLGVSELTYAQNS